MLAAHLLDTIPAIMNEWRKVMNDGLPQGLTVNQYRVLYFVSTGFESQCLMAKHLGVTAAAMSKMVDGLVEKKMITRKGHLEDRRHIILSISASGKKIVKQMRLQVEKRMQAHLDVLATSQQKEIEKALITLQSVFSVIGEK
jgi:DNA-binding MarR family transcriptional regulator